MLLKEAKEKINLVEVFCPPTSTLTKAAQSSGLKAEDGPKETSICHDLQAANLPWERLRQLRPKRLWLFPECGPYSIMQHANQRAPQQTKALRKKEGVCSPTIAKLHSSRMVASRARWCVLYRTTTQVHDVALARPDDPICIGPSINLLYSRPMFRRTATPETWLSNAKGTRIQTNDTSFADQCAQRCVGRGYDHVPIEGGNVTRGTAFYPNMFCQRVVQNMENAMKPHPNVS